MPTRGKHGRQAINKQTRLTAFRSQFSTCCNYGIPVNYFEAKGKDKQSQFDRDCCKILDGFKFKVSK